MACTLKIGWSWKLFCMPNGGDLYSKFNLLRFTKPPKLQKFGCTKCIYSSDRFCKFYSSKAFLRRNHCSPRQSLNQADRHSVRNSCNILLSITLRIFVLPLQNFVPKYYHDKTISLQSTLSEMSVREHQTCKVQK